LVSWQDKYEVALICGANDPKTDRYAAQSISISTLHTIRPEVISIEAPPSAAMTSEIQTLAIDLLRDYNPPTGTTAVAYVQIWNEIVLFPANMNLSDIQR